MLHELRDIALTTLDPATEDRLMTLIARLESAEPDELDRRLAGLIVSHCRQDVADTLFRRMAAGRVNGR